MNRNDLQDLSARQNMFSYVAQAQVDYRVYKDNSIFAYYEMDSIDAEQWEVKKQNKTTFAIGLTFSTLG